PPSTSHLCPPPSDFRPPTSDLCPPTSDFRPPIFRSSLVRTTPRPPRCLGGRLCQPLSYPHGRASSGPGSSPRPPRRARRAPGGSLLPDRHLRQPALGAS